MKKILNVVLLFIFLISLSSCNGVVTSESMSSSSSTTKSSNNSSQSSSTKTGFYIDDALKSQHVSDMYRTYYEIYPGAFSDSDGDGMGDLQGIINRFDYINDGDDNSSNSLGATGIWLMPIMKSPSYHKYDVIDYKSVDPRYGTIETFDKLSNLCKERDVNLIIDLVLNHTSSSNAWFKEAKEALSTGDYNNKYIKYYSIVTSGNRTSGHNWVHLVGDYYYEANFSDNMPELNMDNPEVRDEIVSIIKFWFARGVGGFRLDAVKYIYIYNEEKNIEFLQWFMDEVRKIKSDAYVVAEDWSSEAEIEKYYKSVNCFDFSMSNYEGSAYSAATGIDHVDTFVANLMNYKSNVLQSNENAILNPFLSNHDQDRSAGYLSASRGTLQMAANLYILSSGNPFIYYGEEIGMKGSGRDENKRLAMLWGDGDTVRDPVAADFDSSRQINGTVEDQLKDPNSILNHYKKLIAIRKACPEIARGTYQNLNINNGSLEGGFVATYNEKSVLVFHNPLEVGVKVDLSKYTKVQFSTIVATLGVNGNCSLDGQVLSVPAMSSVVLR